MPKIERKEKTKLITRREVTVSLPVIKVPGPFQGFIDFVREQGVVGLAVGLVLGTQVKVLVDQLVASSVNPLIGLALPGTGNLPERMFHIKDAQFAWGAFLSQFISFLVVALLIYMVVHRLKLDKLDKKKS